MFETNDYKFMISLALTTIILSLAVIYNYVELPQTGFIDFMIDFSLRYISESKYIAIFVLMLLESALVPIPSEIVMPFSGFLCYLGRLSLISVVLAASIGNLIGSLIAYWLGIHYGRPFLTKYGKYLLITEEHLDYAERLFNKHGEPIILISRMLPAVRTVISFPAGIGRMRLDKFIIYTFIGSLPWNFILTYVGFMLGDKWFIIFDFSRKLDLIIIIDGLILLLWLIKKFSVVA